MRGQSTENILPIVLALVQFHHHRQAVLVRATHDHRNLPTERAAIHLKTKVERAPPRRRLTEEKIKISKNPRVTTNSEVE